LQSQLNKTIQKNLQLHIKNYTTVKQILNVIVTYCHPVGYLAVSPRELKRRFYGAWSWSSLSIKHCCVLG